MGSQRPRRAAPAVGRVLVGVAALALLGATPAGAAGAAGTSWTVYHGSPSGSGVGDPGGDLSSPRRAWVSRPLDGPIYGEPVVERGRVIVATERDTVDALSVTTGRVLWSTSVGRPVPSTRLPCGDVSPTVGVTGTPVVDPVRRDVFVVADELVHGHPAHRLVGLSLSTGRVVLSVAVDPPGADPAAILQRTGLALDDGRVVFGFGGNEGDCGDYHGWVVSVGIEGPGRGTVRRYEADAGPGERQGAVWMGGAAPEVSANGDVWVAEGNGSVGRAGRYDGSDSVVELDQRLHRVAFFAPSHWYEDNARDLDLGSTAPALVGSGSVVQVGKSGTAYLLDQRAPGGIGGQLASLHVCGGSTADGGDAVTGGVVYLPCTSGTEALRAGGSTLRALWRASGPTGPPIVAGGLVWAVGGDDLYGLDPATGAVRVHRGVGSNANHFPTPSAADGRLLVTGGTRGDEVLAFAGT